jgi:hypothetical protein
MQASPIPDKTRTAKIILLRSCLSAKWRAAESLSLLNIAGKLHKLPPFLMAATVIQVKRAHARIAHNKNEGALPNLIGKEMAPYYIFRGENSMPVGSVFSTF